MNDEPRMAPEPESAEERHDRLYRLNKFRTSGPGVALFYGYLVAILVTAYVVGRAVLDNSRTAHEAHRAVCALKIERVHRVDQTLAILEHPDDPENARIIATFGRPLLLRSLATAREDAKALSDVSC
jgi:hypothetical protein